MQPQLLWMFQRQVLMQCEIVLRADEEITGGLERHDNQSVFSGIQNLLNASANIAKALWGQGGNLAAARQPLRDSIEVSDNSPLNEVRMRNNFEHFDERLDRWWRESKDHRFADTNVMPSSAIHGFDEIDRFRAFDSKTGELSFWGDEFNIPEIVNEVRRILPTLREAVSEPPK